MVSSTHKHSYTTHTPSYIGEIFVFYLFKCHYSFSTISYVVRMFNFRGFFFTQPQIIFLTMKIQIYSIHMYTHTQLSLVYNNDYEELSVFLCQAKGQSTKEISDTSDVFINTYLVPDSRYEKKKF